MSDDIEVQLQKVPPIQSEDIVNLGAKSSKTVVERGLLPPDPTQGYTMQMADDNWAVTFQTPANRLQRFLQLLVGIQWRPRV